ncbi:phosphatase PAP2 family protein [Alkanindiges illinoisensis]|uniref:phosphatase PAP2 family protein n=1 Tax=Alkanindiges illinoisensis TaxID=197183 RepID=UPI000A023192|nr:phosphatase PAP2 family protein [Alkanindiges illinoisensis]
MAITATQYSKTFWLFNTAGLLAYALLLIQFFPVNGVLDHWLIAPWVDSTGRFFERDNWWLTHIAHHGVKNVIIGLIVILLIQFIGSFYRAGWRHYRLPSGYVLISALCTTTLVGLLKSQSGHACPWSLVQVQQHHLVWLDHLSKAGHCFPGGHASAGFALIALFFAYWQSQPHKARYYLLAALLLGFAMGWGQMMRGAHFLSHNLWTLWVAWAVNLGLCAIIQMYAWYAQQRQNPQLIGQAHLNH